MTAKAAKTVKYGSSVDGISTAEPDTLPTHTHTHGSSVDGISTAEPDQYAKRFLAFMDEAIE